MEHFFLGQAFHFFPNICEILTHFLIDESNKYKNKMSNIYLTSCYWVSWMENYQKQKKTPHSQQLSGFLNKFQCNLFIILNIHWKNVPCSFSSSQFTVYNSKISNSNINLCEVSEILHHICKLIRTITKCRRHIFFLSSSYQLCVKASTNFISF